MFINDDLTQLSGAVNRGELMLDPEGLDEARKQLKDHIADLKQLQRQADGLDAVSGFGDFPMGIALAKKFSQKASGDGSLMSTLSDLFDQATMMQDVIEKSVKAFKDHEAAVAASVRNAGEHHG